MIGTIFKKRKGIKKISSLVEPDEIFLDSENLQNFDRQQFEGRIEKPISKKTILFINIFFIIIAFSFGLRLGYLQIGKGGAYFNRSENNILEKQIIFSDRGIIYDRNGKELAWNKKEARSSIDEKDSEGTNFSVRSYLSPGFSHVLGYVSYPMQDKFGNYWQSEFIGKDGLEKQYDFLLKGENGSKIVETDARKEIHSENVVNAPERGKNLKTTIDWRIQKQLFSLIKNLSQNNSFSGGAGILLNVQNGEILSSVSFPEYDSEILSQGKDAEKIKEYTTDKRKVFLDRTISGLYTPGSIVKPFLAIGALAENIIDPYKKILSTGSISIPNPYFPDKETVFKDWKAHGWVDMRKAIAVSSDVYFYEIGGGFEKQKGLGIVNIDKYSKIFGIGEKTGINIIGEKEGNIPTPEWKTKTFEGEIWRIGDTYHTAIGQYGFQVTPMEMLRAVSAVANYGFLISPHFILEEVNPKTEILVENSAIKKEYYDIIHEGMRQSVLVGTSISLNVPYVQVAAKTGTAQLGVSKNRVNSWIVGFFPYENPKYAFTVMMESGPASGAVGASSIMRQLLDWMSIYAPEYLE